MVKNWIVGLHHLPRLIPGLFQNQRVIPLLLSTSTWLLSLDSVQAQSVVSTSTSSSQIVHSGTQVSLNGKNLPIAWSQQRLSTGAGRVYTGISDAGLMQLLGVELLNTKDATKQPIRWFSQPGKTSLVLNSWHKGPYRYLDVNQLTPLADWQLKADGNTLRITTPAAKVKAIRQGQQPWGERIVIDLDRPTPWQVTQQQFKPKPIAPKIQLPTGKLSVVKSRRQPKQEWVVAISAAVNPALVKSFNASKSAELSIAGNSSQLPVVRIASSKNSTSLRLRLPPGLYPRIDTLANPNRLIVDLRPDAMVERDISWSPGLRWRQQFVNVGAYRFPVVWLEIEQGLGIALKPISSSARSLVGISPLIKTAQSYSVAAAINGGFFNRKNQLPLGAIRRDGQWLSSPILNRGAIAWNDAGQVKIGRIHLQDNIITSSGQRLPILSLNSGYIQPGITRYTPAWGSTYTPLVDNEIILVIQNDQVTAQLPGGAAGKTAFPIPLNGYLLTLRGQSATATLLPVGTIVSQESSTIPLEFDNYPQIVGAGPLLVQNSQIVLNAKAEGFSDAFIREKAARSAICTTASGRLIIAAVHNRIKGSGPTLAEIAKVMQKMGCKQALNLDGGSSTSLYLGGQLLNRSPRTAARVHNGLGVFLDRD